MNLIQLCKKNLYLSSLFVLSLSSGIVLAESNIKDSHNENVQQSNSYQQKLKMIDKEQRKQQNIKAAEQQKMYVFAVDKEAEQLQFIDE